MEKDYEEFDNEVVESETEVETGKPYGSFGWYLGDF